MNKQITLQHTLKKTVSFVGRGLHSGSKSRITLKPCDDTTGIFFRRKDIKPSQAFIAARWYKVTDTNLSTMLTNQYGVSVSTVEHLLAALRICQIDNLEIEVDGPEIPIMDGSAMPFVDTLNNIGIRSINADRKAIWIHKIVEVREADRYALLVPDIQPRVTVSIDFQEKAIGAQTLSVNLNDPSLAQTIAPARTFGFLDQIEELHNRGLALGGSLKNAILVDDHKVVNQEGLRFKDEFVRHKVLDAIEDMSLVGVPIIGHYHAFKDGHLLNKLLLNKLIMDKSAWSYVSLDDFYQLHDIESGVAAIQDTNIEEPAEHTIMHETRSFS